MIAVQVSKLGQMLFEAYADLDIVDPPVGKLLRVPLHVLQHARVAAAGEVSVVLVQPKLEAKLVEVGRHGGDARGEVVGVGLEGAAGRALRVQPTVVDDDRVVAGRLVTV